MKQKIYFEKYFISKNQKNETNFVKKKTIKMRNYEMHTSHLAKTVLLFSIINIGKKENLPFGVFSHIDKITNVWDLRGRWEWLVEEEEIVWGDLELSVDCLTVTYRSFGGSDEDSAAIRGNFKVDGGNALSYFEVEILSTGREGFIGVGMTHICSDLDRLPGWEMYSFGYHGDDGHFFDCSGTGKIYGPKFSKGDIIGVCWNLIEKTVFFTKNGLGLPFAFVNYSFFEMPFMAPVVGLRSEGETVRGNFGGNIFEFDIEKYFENFQKKLKSKIILSGKLKILREKKSKLFSQNSLYKKKFKTDIILDTLKKIRKKNLEDTHNVFQSIINPSPIIYLDTIMEKSYLNSTFEKMDNFLFNAKNKKFFFNSFFNYTNTFFKKNNLIRNFKEYLIKFSIKKQEIRKISNNFPYNLIFGKIGGYIQDIWDILNFLNIDKFPYTYLLLNKT